MTSFVSRQMPVISPQNRPIRLNFAGFTLIEVLVVLIIIGMVSGILFQALERAYRLQDRFGVELYDLQQKQMVADWFRQTVQGLHPDYHDGANKFKGAEKEFSGLTSNALSGEYGKTASITWTIRNNPSSGNTELVYRENIHETPVLNWRTNNARFVYLDDKLTPYSSWPPPLGVYKQLPKVIYIESRDLAEPISIVASPMGPTAPTPRLQDMM